MCRAFTNFLTGVPFWVEGGGGGNDVKLYSTRFYLLKVLKSSLLEILGFNQYNVTV